MRNMSFGFLPSSFFFFHVYAIFSGSDGIMPCEQLHIAVCRTLYAVGTNVPYMWRAYAISFFSLLAVCHLTFIFIGKNTLPHMLSPLVTRSVKVKTDLLHITVITYFVIQLELCFKAIYGKCTQFDYTTQCGFIAVVVIWGCGQGPSQVYVE